MADIIIENGESFPVDKEQVKEVDNSITYLVKSLHTRKEAFNLRIIFSDDYSTDVNKYKKYCDISDLSKDYGIYLPISALKNPDINALPLIIINNKPPEYEPPAITIIHELVHYCDEKHMTCYCKKFGIDIDNRIEQSYDYKLLQYFQRWTEFRATYFEEEYRCEVNEPHWPPKCPDPVLFFKRNDLLTLHKMESCYSDKLVRQCGKLFGLKNFYAKGGEMEYARLLDNCIADFKKAFLIVMHDKYLKSNYEPKYMLKPIEEKHFHFKCFRAFIEIEFQDFIHPQKP